MSADSFSFALQGGLKGGDDEDDEEDSFVWMTVMLLKDCEKAWGSVGVAHRIAPVIA